MRMKKLVFSLLVAVVVLTSCREKEKPHNEEAVAPNQEVSLGILPYDGIAPEKQTLKLNVFVADVASNFSTDEQLAEKTKKRIIKGLEVKPSYSEINLVNKVDENTDVIIYGTVAKQTETKIDAQDVVIAYTINIVSANAKTGEIIQSISQTSDRSIEKTVAELSILNGDTYLQQARKYFEIRQFDDCIAVCNKALDNGVDKVAASTLCAESSIELGELDMAKKYLENTDAFNSEDKRSIYLTGKYYRLSKEYDNAINRLKSGIPEKIIGGVIEQNNEGVAEDILSNSISVSTTNDDDEKDIKYEKEVPAQEKVEELSESETPEVLDESNYQKKTEITAPDESPQESDIVEMEETEGVNKPDNDYPTTIKILEELAQTYFEMDNYQNAGRMVELLKANDLNNNIALLVSSKIETQKGDFQKAIDVLAEVKENSALLLERAKCKTELGLFESAQKDIEMAVKKNKITLEENKLMAKTYYGLKKYDEALIFCEASIAFHPTAEDYCLRGMIYSKINEVEEAAEDYRKAIDLEPSYKEAYYELGKLQFENNQFESAVSSLNKAEELGAHSVELYLVLAESYIQVKNFPAAINSLKEIEKKEPENKKMLEDMGIAYFGQESYSEATDYFAKRIGYKTSNPYLAMYHAMSLHFSHSYTNAISYYEQAVTLFNDSKEHKKWISFCKNAVKECKKERQDILSELDEIYIFPIDF